MTKISLFIDETGQDTNGKLFILSIVLLSSKLDLIRSSLEKIEQESGKHLKKWQKTRSKERINYIQSILNHEALKGSLFFSYYQNAGKEYLPLTVYTVANLISSQVKVKSLIHITVDALNKKEKTIITAKLRQFNFSIEKVTGRRDQSDPLLRLADALAGFVRDGIEKHPKTINLFRSAIQNNIIQEIK